MTTSVIGTTTLFTALDVKSGKVISECLPRHRAKEFLKFLRIIDKTVPARRDVRLILANYATHKTPDVRAWLDKHPHPSQIINAQARVQDPRLRARGRWRYRTRRGAQPLTEP